MREVIIAALIIGVILIIWDLTKVFLSTRQKDEETPIVIGDPGREKVQKYAKSFQNLADTFYNLPYHKEHLTSQDVEEIFAGVAGKICCRCERYEACWKKKYFETYRMAYGVLNKVEEYGEEASVENQAEFSASCLYPDEFLNEMIQTFHRAKLNLLWNNRLLENRIAVAEQLNEMAGIMTGVAENIYDVTETGRYFEAGIRKKLKSIHIMVKRISVRNKKDEKQEVYITMKAAKGKCITAREVGIAVSKVCRKAMVPEHNSRVVINQELCTVLFVEDTHFQCLTGVARVNKEGETVSGDNFAFITRDNGQLVMSLSDGMGTGVHACKESEMVIELLEQFLEAGFSKETAVKMINSAMVIQSGEKSFSTIDICSIDLYTGIGEFLKIGAATTFIKRDNWVESITSTSLPAGILQQVDYEITSKKLYNGDFIILVSDGVLDALPDGKSEEVMKEIILQVQSSNAKEVARAILERVLIYHNCQASDDMTVLAGGIWKK